jgi:hypothetical protein
MALYTNMRKLHRALVLAILVSGGAMAVTGIILKFFNSLDSTGLIRYVHGNLSIFFTIILALMAFSGSFLFLYPWHLRRKAKKQASEKSKDTANAKPGANDAAKSYLS